MEAGRANTLSPSLPPDEPKEMLCSILDLKQAHLKLCSPGAGSPRDHFVLT